MIFPILDLVLLKSEHSLLKASQAIHNHVCLDYLKMNALINRMGFNNDGVDDAVERLKNRKSNIIVGGNIGKNKVTPNENALDDYLICFENSFDYVDYFVVNVSSAQTHLA